MMIDLTYACSMNCPHCLSDCKPDGQNMPLSVLRDTLEFARRHQIPIWNFSGGEMFEHPEILKVLRIIESEHEKLIGPCMIVFITNGRVLARNPEIYEAVTNMKKRIGKRNMTIQVTDDPKYYRDPLTDKERYRLKKLDALIDSVPVDPLDMSRSLYPQGRALQNFPEQNWYTNGPKCANCVLVSRQIASGSFAQFVRTMSSSGFMCTPAIAPDGSIKIGESALCPPIASIYDDEATIMDKIRRANCRACKIPWERMKDRNPVVYALLEAY